jgi:hypothetical protein
MAVTGVTGRVQVEGLPSAPLRVHDDHLAAEVGPLREPHGTAHVTVDVPNEGQRHAAIRFDLEDHH